MRDCTRLRICRGRGPVSVLLLAALAVFLHFAPAAAQETTFRAGARTNVVVDGEENVVALGGRVSVLGNARGDLSVFGGAIEVDAVTEGEAAVFGGSIDFRGRFGKDATVMGGSVEIGAEVGGKLQAVGASLTVTEAARMAAGSSLAGASVEFAGTALGALTVNADEVTVSGTVQGPLTVNARSVTIAPGAKIDGELILRTGGTPNISDQASIGGEITMQEPEPEGPDPRDWAFGWMIVLAFAASAFVVGASVTLLMPDIMTSATDMVGSRTGLVLINGLLAAIGGPIVALALMAMVVTFPLGIFLFMAFPLLALLGHGIMGNALGRRLLALVMKEPNTFMRLVGLAAGVGIIAAVGLLPFVGIVLVLILLIVGVGAGLLAFAEQLFGSFGKRAT